MSDTIVNKIKENTEEYFKNVSKEEFKEDLIMAGFNIREEITMTKVFVNKEATILNGKCAGISGMVVGANSVENTVEIEVEEGTCIITTFQNVFQEKE